jgi:hypothetical protein
MEVPFLLIVASFPLYLSATLLSVFPLPSSPEWFQNYRCEDIIPSFYNIEYMLPRIIVESPWAASVPTLLRERLEGFPTPYTLIYWNATCYAFWLASQTGENVWEAGTEVAASFLLPALRSSFPQGLTSRHLLLFPHDVAACLFPEELRRFVWKATWVVFAKFNSDSPYSTPFEQQGVCFRDSDIVIPPPVPFPDLSAPLLRSPRNITAFFFGTVFNKSAYSHGLRQFLRDTPPASVTVFPTARSPLYPHILRHSSFCLAPGGWAPWSGRIYDCLFHGSIPVLFTDGLTLPYEPYIPWDEISVRVKHKDVSNLDAILAAISEEDRRRMRLRISLFARSLSWHRHDRPGALIPFVQTLVDRLPPELEE